MKKIILSVLLVSLLVFTACSTPETATPAPDQEVEQTTTETPAPAPTPSETPVAETEEPVKEPAPVDGPKVDGSASKTLKYYRDLFNSPQYTMKQYMSFTIGDVETKSTTTTMRDGERYAVVTQWQSGEGEPSTFRIIMDGDTIYNVDDATKTYWSTPKSEEMDIPMQTGELMKQFERMEYVQGEAEVDGKVYQTETYVDQGLTMTYFFDGNVLKFIDAISENASTRTYIESAETSVDKAMFEIPDDYTESQDGGMSPVG